MTGTTDLTPEEQANLDLAHEYMRIAYTPGLASADAVRHLCAEGNRFVGPTTFPGTETLEEYADVHGELMTKLDDLHFVSFDIEMVQGDRVAFRYTATGTHKGAPHGDVQPTGRTATWTAHAVPRRGRQARGVRQGVEQAADVGAARLARRGVPYDE